MWADQQEGPDPIAFSQAIVTKELKPFVGLTMTFDLKDMSPLQTLHNDALVIQLKIVTTIVHQTLVDIGSFVDIILHKCLKKLQHYEKNLEAVEVPMVGFGGRATYSIGDKESSRTIQTNFLIVDINMASNAIKIVVAPYFLLI